MNKAAQKQNQQNNAEFAQEMNTNTGNKASQKAPQNQSK
jgi:hypothetical protein